MIRNFIFVLWALLFPLLAAGQAALGISDRGVFDYPAWVENGDDSLFTLVVINKGTTTYSDTVFVFNKINADLPFPIDTVTGLSISPGDSAVLTVRDIRFSTPQYRLGGNLVLIWPTGKMVPTVDTARTQVVLAQGAAFGFGNFELVGFPASPDTVQQYSFDAHIFNFGRENYEDTLFVVGQVNGGSPEVLDRFFRVVPDSSGFFHTISNYQFSIPPYQLGVSKFRMWVHGTDSTVAIDTLSRNIYIGIISVDDLFSRGEPVIFPNPSTGSITLDLNGWESPHLSVRILDVTGQVIWKGESGFSGGEMDLSAFSSGTYYVEIENQGNQMFRKRISLLR